MFQDLQTAVLCLIGVVTAVPHSQKDTQVLILGGGAAGLATAKTLAKNNIDFILLEGSERLGGRVKKAHFAGKTIEIGANWIVGDEGNPLWDIAKDTNFGGKNSDWESVIIRNSTGFDVTDPEGTAAWSKIEDVDEVIEGIAKRIQSKGEDMSARACLGIADWRPTTAVEKAVEIFEFDYEFGNTPDVTSCFSYNQSTSIIDEVFYVKDRRGYEFLLHEYVKDVFAEKDRLHLGEIVTKIDMSDSKVAVETNRGYYTADYAVITFSVGVLQGQTIEFEPDLPQWKIDSLNRVRLENFFGIYLKFPDTVSRFWDDVEFILYADERRGYFPVWQNLEAEGLSPAGTNILEIMAIGEEADRVSQMSTSDIQNEVMAMLRRVYNDPSIPDPEDIFVPNWRNDHLYRGSFANLEPGASLPDAFASISAPVERLHFAGEAYESGLVGYVYGAIKSGERTAREISKKLRNVNDD